MAWAKPYFPAIALALSTVCLFAIIYYNWLLSLYFFGGLVAVILVFMLMGKHKLRITNDVLLEKAAVMVESE